MEAYLLLFWNKFSLTSVFFYLEMSCFARVPCNFPEVSGRGSSSFYLICKPTASALENEQSDTRLFILFFLAMLAKIGFVYRGNPFCTFVDRLCCNHFGMMFDFVLMIQHRKC